MHHAAEDMVLTSVHCPLEFNQLLDSNGLEDFELLGLIDQAHEVAVTVDELDLGTISVLSNVLADLRKDVDGIGDLVNLAGVDLRGIDIFFIVGIIQRRNVWENGLIVVSQLEDRIVVASLVSIVVSVGTRPVIKVERKAEYV